MTCLFFSFSFFIKQPVAPDTSYVRERKRASNAPSDDVNAHVCCDNRCGLVYSPRVGHPGCWGNEQKLVKEKRGLALGTAYIIWTYGSVRPRWTLNMTCAFFFFFIMCAFVCMCMRACVCVWLKFLSELLQAVTSPLSGYKRLIKRRARWRTGGRVRVALGGWGGDWWNSFWIMEEWNAAAGGVRPYVSARLPRPRRDSWSDWPCSSELGSNQSKTAGAARPLV